MKVYIRNYQTDQMNFPSKETECCNGKRVFSKIQVPIRLLCDLNDKWHVIDLIYNLHSEHLYSTCALFSPEVRFAHR